MSESEKKAKIKELQKLINMKLQFFRILKG